MHRTTPKIGSPRILKLAKLLSFLILFIPFVLSAQQQQDQPSELYGQIQKTIQTQNLNEFLSLAVTDSESQNELKDFFEDFQSFKSTQTILRLADETETRMILHVLLQRRDESAFQSWSISTVKDENKQRIQSAHILSTIDGLYRLQVGQKALAISDLTIAHIDASLQLSNGFIFPILAGGKLAGVVFLGKGRFIFGPSDLREQHQLFLFNKKPKLEVSVNQFFLRASSTTLRSLLGNLNFEQGISKSDLYQKALEISTKGNANAFGIHLPFGEDLWFPRLLGADLYAELKTQSGDLIYQFAPKEMEDIILIDQQEDRVVSLYSSTGSYVAAPESSDLEIVSYKMNLSYNPNSAYLSGVSEIRLRSNEVSSTAVFKLNPSLRVTRIDGSQGSLIYFQERNTNNLHVILSEILEVDREITLRFHYQGRIEPDKGRAEVQRISPRTRVETEYFLPPSYLYSNSSQWYPQLLARPYSPLKITISVPLDYAAISNGELKKREEQGDRIFYTYDCEQPVKYFSLLVGRMNANLSFESIVPMNVFFYSLDRTKAQQQAELADRILRFYEGYFGKYPYSSLNLVLRPSEEPGGHAPATFVIANRVFTFSQSRIGKDPLNIPEYPEFFLAHEIAHQWWGQAVGWKSYRDQWLSEGFAHFAAAEFIRSLRGEEAWLKLSRIFFSWVEDKTAAGPIWLGSRLGHLTDDPQAFSALLYNKGAYVLVMLKNWLGEENFSKCLADFFEKFKHKKATIDDFQQIAQLHSKEDLDPFFDQWLSRWDMPEVKWNYSVRQEDDGVTLKIQCTQSTKHPYVLKLPIVAKSSGGKQFQTDVMMNKSSQEFEIKIPFVPSRVELDPLKTNLLRIVQ